MVGNDAASTLYISIVGLHWLQQAIEELRQLTRSPLIGEDESESQQYESRQFAITRISDPRDTPQHPLAGPDHSILAAQTHRPAITFLGRRYKVAVGAESPGFPGGSEV